MSVQDSREFWKDGGKLDSYIKAINATNDTYVDKFVTGVKYDNDKPQWSLMQWGALTEVVDVLTYGAKKYSPDNWKKVPNARQRYLDAGFRHFTAYAAGEKNDSETGMSHLAHAMCCMLFLLAFDKDEMK
jgi:hypothetical protein